MSPSVIKWVLKPAVFVAGLGPAAWLIWAGLTNNLSANPLSDITNETGLWTLRFLCLTLAVTPVRRLTKWQPIIRFRRMLGNYAFFYGSLLGVFVLAIGVKRATANGAFFGLIAGMGTIALIHYGFNSDGQLMSFLWYNVVGCLAVVTVGIAWSLVSVQRGDESSRKAAE